MENTECSVDMESLVGKHFLTGVDESRQNIEKWSGFEDCQCINFTLDGITYTAIEDPEDGYRSCLDAIIISGIKLSNIFEPIEVLVSYRTISREYGNGCEILDFFDVKNGERILEIGTDNTKDYYPCFVASWIPENLSINKGR